MRRQGNAGVRPESSSTLKQVVVGVNIVSLSRPGCSPPTCKSCFRGYSINPTGETMTATGPNTSLDTIETSAPPQLPNDYRLYRRRHCQSEWEAAYELYVELDDIETAQRSERFEACRSFAYFARHSETGEVRVVSSACKLRWCPVCSRARSSFLVSQVHEWLKTVSRPKFLTLTMKHSNAPLDHQIKWLYARYRKFRVRKLLKRKISGGIWFFQLKRSKDGSQWHPHLHTVIDAAYIPQAVVSAEWQKTTGSSSIVDIRAIRSKKAVSEYVSRYCSKPAQLSDYTLRDRILIHRVFHGRRLCGTWGTGNRIQLSRRSSADRDSWVSIGSWTAVIMQLETLPRARAIVRAWQTNNVLPQGVTVDYPKAVNQYEECAESIPRLGIEDLRGNFEEFL